MCTPISTGRHLHYSLKAPGNLSALTKSLSPHLSSQLRCLLDVPECVEHFSIIPDAKELIRSGYPVGISTLGVPKKGIWDPDAAHHVGVQCEGLQGAVETKTPVIPRLSKKDIDGIFLWKRKQNMSFLEACLSERDSGKAEPCPLVCRPTFWSHRQSICFSSLGAGVGDY